MIKEGSKVQLIGLGKKDNHRGTFNPKDFTGVVRQIYFKRKGGVFGCIINTTLNAKKGIYMNRFYFTHAKLKEIK